MKFDKLSLFSENQSVAAGANTSVYSKVIDLRNNGQVGIDGMLKVYGQVIGTVNSTGSLTTVLQTSAGGASWTDVASETQNGATLIAMFLPCKGLKRFIRLKYEQGGTALGSAIAVKAGLVDQFDQDELPDIANPFASTDPADLGEALGTALKLSATSGTIAKGSSGTVSVTAGAVTGWEVPSDKYTVTQSGATITIALASTAANGTVYFIDGLGNKVGYAVTAGS